MDYLVFWEEKDKEELPGRIGMRGSPGELRSLMIGGRMIEDAGMEGTGMRGEIEMAGGTTKTGGKESTGEIGMIGVIDLRELIEETEMLTKGEITEEVDGRETREEIEETEMREDSPETEMTVMTESRSN